MHEKPFMAANTAKFIEIYLKMLKKRVEFDLKSTQTTIYHLVWRCFWARVLPPWCPPASRIKNPCVKSCTWPRTRPVDIVSGFDRDAIDLKKNAIFNVS